MRSRNYWLDRIKHAWSNRSIVWLSGVRRVGKTTLAKMLVGDKVVYRNCDLPSVIRELSDSELFLASQEPNSTIILDEIHQLSNPSHLLKIAADEYPEIKILATGSSTLDATQKFSDSLTGRKHTISLVPILWSECKTVFDISDLDRRLLHGGLPETLLASPKNHEFYSEWFQSFYARDIVELFQLRNRSGFLDLLRLLLHQSGGQLDYSKLSKEIGISRPTVLTYIDILNVSHVVHLVSPYSGGGRREIVKRPKAYCFDTGFVTWQKGWDSIRDSDRGILWEHLVLDSLHYLFPNHRVQYWRDKSGREIDFVIPRNQNQIDIFECKINPDNISTDAVHKFRSAYPDGRNYIVSPFVKEPYRFSRSQLLFDVISLDDTSSFDS